MKPPGPALPPALVERLLARCLPPGVVGASVLGDLREELDQRPPGCRRTLWYTAVAARLGAGYLIAGRHRQRSPHRPKTAVGEVHMPLRYEIRFAVRALSRRRGLSAAALATLGIGIGATVAIASLVDRVLLRPLPFARSHELVSVWNTYPAWRGHEVLGDQWDQIALSYPEYLDWRRDQRSFASVAVFRQRTMTLTGGDAPRTLAVTEVSASLFTLLEARPVLGRLLTDDEEGPAAPRVAVLAHGAWQRHLGGSADALDATLTLDGRPYTVVGVLPKSFRFRNTRADRPAADVWIPIGPGGGLDDRGFHVYEAIGRLRPEVPFDHATDEAARLLGSQRAAGYQGARLVPRARELTAGQRRPLLLMMGAGVVIMLIACGNVAGLLVSSGIARRHELATRAALGATGSHLVRHLLVESVVLGLLGGAAGVAVARALVAVLVRLAPATLALPSDIGLDHRTLLFAVSLALATSLVFGLAPALVALRVAGHGTLRRGPGQPAGWRPQRLVVAAELALALGLLVAGGLLGRSLLATSRVSTGFDGSSVLTARLSLQGDAYGDEPARLGFLAQLVERLEALPGVEAVSGMSAVPFSGNVGSSSFQIVGRESEVGLSEAVRMTALPDFHRVLGIPILAGRGFDRTDDARGRPAVMISATMADRYWPDGTALGARVRRDDIEWTVIGIVDDILHDDLTALPRPTFYFPRLQEATGEITMTVAAAAPTAALSTAVRAAAWSLDAALPVDEVAWIPSLVSRSMAEERFRALLILAFAASAAVLAGVGLYSVTARAVHHRRQELGVRMALGADRRRVLGLVLADHAKVLAAGVAVGTLLSVLGVGLVRPFLFGIESHDPWSYGFGVGMLVLLGLAAALVPALRSARLRPSELLRSE